ncbi:MAG: hypothetical protein WDO18_04595 [Acidobacteriota bacterium]
MLALWCAAVCLGIVVAARWLIGPFDLFGIAVHTPLNPEGIFGLLIVALLALRKPAEPVSPEQRSWPIWAAFAVAIVGLSPALRVYFLSDDFIVVKGANATTLASLVHAWTAAGGDGFFRPMGYVSLALDALWAGYDPLRWHASAMLIHAANAALVALLALRWRLSAMAAFAAGAIFALHGTHLEAAVWIAGRFDLLATFFTLATLVLYGYSRPLALLTAAGALCSKEAAFCLPLILFLVEWQQGRNPKRTAPFFGLAAAIFAYRWVLLGGIGGYRDSSGASTFFGLKFASTAKVLFARLWTSLFFPLNWSGDPAMITAVLAVLYIAALLWIARNPETSATLRLALGALLLAILPPLHLLGGSADLSGGRLLYLPSVFFCIFLASAIPPRATAVVVAFFVAFFMATLIHDLHFWQSTSQQVKEICQSPDAPAPTMIDGVPALANGLAECREKR